MKKTTLILCLIAFNISFSQSGKIYPKNDRIIIGGENTYIYEPSEKMKITDGALVNTFLGYNKISVPLTKQGNYYQFSVKVPESESILILTITDKQNNIVDSNADKGFVVNLKDRTEDEKIESKLAYLKSWNVANYLLNLKITPDETIKQFEEIYNQNSNFKQGNSYLAYFFLKYQENPINSKPNILKEAEKLALNEDEKSLTSASTLYSMLKMNTESDKIKVLAILKFPKGEIAKQKYLNEFYFKKSKTVAYVLESFQEYSTKFNDTTPQSKDNFYVALINIYLEKKDIINIKKYENLLSDNKIASSIYNNYAWELSGQDLNSPGSNLNFAADLSKRSLSIIEELMKKNNSSKLQGTHNMYADTYALILYKQKKYEEAFKYQDVVEKNGGLDTGGKERYAAIAEKAKGAEFSKEYLEKQLLAGVDSKVLLNQLQEVYKKLKLPINEFENIKTNSLKLATQKAKEELIKMYGDIKAIDFTLTNLHGKKIKLSDYKGKMVVLDFWATWCGPCRSSFPKMQELVTKYKNDNIEFFFINTWERDSNSEIKKSVSKFIKENNYSFNVLFDFEDKIVTNYKIKGIPTKIVIDKEGNIISINSSESNLVGLIEENIK